MRDEMESRIWVAHHEAFSDWAGQASAAAIATLRRLLRALAAGRFGGWTRRVD